jgi:hypothetical protein
MDSSIKKFHKKAGDAKREKNKNKNSQKGTAEIIQRKKTKGKLEKCCQQNQLPGASFLLLPFSQPKWTLATEIQRRVNGGIVVAAAINQSLTRVGGMTSWSYFGIWWWAQL